MLLGDLAPQYFALQNSHPGLFVRNPQRAFVALVAAQALIYAGVYALQLGGVLAIADISGPEPGPFPPHKSHENGFDADVAYVLNGKYPTPLTTKITPQWVAVVHALSPMLEQVFMSNARIAEFASAAATAPLGPLAPLTLTNWAGHQEHAHLRFRSGQVNFSPGVIKPP